MKNKFLFITIAILLLLAVLPTAPVMAQLPGGTLDPTTIDKFIDPLVIPPAMPSAGHGEESTLYRIEAKQFAQQVLPTGSPKTTVWGYGNANGPDPGKPGSTYNWPSYTVETRSNQKVKVYWINGLVDKNRNYLPHILPVDPTLHWANPPGPRDSRPTFTGTPGPYTGPVPIVTHVHGAHVRPDSDGYPEAWYLPNAKNIPAGYYTQGSHYDSVLPAPKGQALFEYSNDQRATTLWYHDHALGMTRANVYAGLAGFWLIRDRIEDSLNLPGPSPRLGDAPGKKYYEIPMAIQDRSFNADGSLFYPDSREFFDGFTGPNIPGTPVPPVWNPEFFGNTMVVNGKTWPYLNVEPRQYRFRLLNGSDSRFLILKLINQDTYGDWIGGANGIVAPDVPSNRPFYQIGSEGGLLPVNPVKLDTLLIAPAERPDVIVDFSGLAPGTKLYLINEGPDEPFGGGIPGVDFTPSDPGTTGQVIELRVVARTGKDTSAPVAKLYGKLPAIAPLGRPDNKRMLSLNEEALTFGSFDGPIAAKLGTMDKDGNPVPLMWEEDITEYPVLNDVEQWSFNNFTEDAHPIHLHLVQFQVVERVDANGVVTGPEPWETGWKDTVIVYPGDGVNPAITRVKAKFDIPGLYVWHCHILSHEDNEMMRPYKVVLDRRGHSEKENDHRK